MAREAKGMMIGTVCSTSTPTQYLHTAPHGPLSALSTHSLLKSHLARAKPEQLLLVQEGTGVRTGGLRASRVARCG